MGFSNTEPAREYQAPGMSIEDIKDRITVITLWKHFQLPGDPLTGRCVHSPLRSEKTPSFMISCQGRRFMDFGSGKGGDVIDFYGAMTNLSEKDSIRDLRAMCGQSIPVVSVRPPKEPKKNMLVPPGEVPEAYAKMAGLAMINLASYGPKGVLKALAERKGWSDGTLMRLAESGHLGNFTDGAIFVSHKHDTPKSIPLNWKICYRYPHGIKCRPDAARSHSDFWVCGKAGENLWRGDRLDMETDRVILFEGESDLISAYQLIGEDERDAFVAIPGSSWNPTPQQAARIASHRKVLICMDDDAAGAAAAMRLMLLLNAHASYARVEIFPWREVTGYIDEPYSNLDIGVAVHEMPKNVLSLFDKFLS